MEALLKRPPRIVVATEAPLAVGVVRWNGTVPAVSVCVKLTFSFAGDSCRLADAQEPLYGDVASGLPGAKPDELERSSDFVPYRMEGAVVLHGHAHSSGPTSALHARFSAGPIARSFDVVAATPATALPLVAAAIRTSAGQLAPPVGPTRWAEDEAPSTVDATEEEPGEEVFPPGPARLGSPELGSFRCSCPEQRGRYLDPGMRIDLVGLSRRAGRSFVLPGVAPIVWAEHAGVASIEQIVMVTDTLCIDTDREIATLCFRGALVVDSIAELVIERLVVVLGSSHAPAPMWSEVAPTLVDCIYGYAVEHDMPEPQPQGWVEALRLELERERAAAVLPRPVLPLETFARIQAEVVEGRAPEGVVLQAHGMSAARWRAEEAAWLASMGEDLRDGKGELAERHAAHFVKAQDELAAQGEDDLDRSVYDRVRGLLAARVPTRVALREVGLTLPAWLRLERRVTHGRSVRGSES
jgi:hypothetical protein